MYNNEKIGVGVVTYNRPKQFKQLFDQLKHIDYIDQIVIVKNKNEDYGDMFDDLPLNVIFINILEDINIGYYKNVILHTLMDNKCNHLFVIEDDVGIKRDDVFKTYIDTAKLFKLKHMTFNELQGLSQNPKYVILKNGVGLDICLRLCGSFSYFHSDAIEFGGYLNYKLYDNALEHIEHFYRLSLQKLTSPFYAFADIHDSFEYLADTNEPNAQASINTTTTEYKIKLHNAYNAFKRIYGTPVNKIRRPSVDETKQYLLSL